MFEGRQYTIEILRNISECDLIIPTEVDPAILTGLVIKTLRGTLEDVHVVQLEGHQVGVVQLVVVPEVTANNLTLEEFKQLTVFNG